MSLFAAISRRFSSNSINVGSLVKTLNKFPKAAPEATPKLGFGRLFTDHMLDMEWTKEKGWGTPHIKPYGDICVPPCASVLHYGMEVFEGTKAYLDPKGAVRLFRPLKNLDRMYKSCERLALPTFDKNAMLELIKQLVLVDRRFIPSGDGYSLYIRPTIIGTHPFLGVSVSEKALFFTILSPVGPYYPEGFKPISLLAESKYVRAWEGGAGNAKIGGNYAPTILPAQLAAKKGFSQVLWLYGEKKYVSEVGTSNLFVLWKNDNGESELITAPLDDGTILDGVTRDSVLALTRSWGQFKVSERLFTMDELVEKLKKKQVLEVFGAGTAAVISPVKGLSYKDVLYEVPVDPAMGIGKISKKILDQLLDIQYGRIEHEWSMVIS